MDCCECLGWALRLKRPSGVENETLTSAGTTFRAARSVHLWWEPPLCLKDEAVEAFYNEVVVQKSTPGTYFMCCGFDGGYFGIQEMCDCGHRVLFSVWDASSEMYQDRDDPTEIDQADKVEILAQASDVLVQRFGGEGTGAQCIDDVTGWTLGTKVACLVECRRDPSPPHRCCYAAFVRVGGEGSAWKHLATYRVAGAKRFQGFYSFIEDFRRDSASVFDERRAEFGPAWLRSASGNWHAPVRSRFTGSGASWERPDNVDVMEGTCASMRVLCTGGNDIAGAHKIGKFTDLLADVRGYPAALPVADMPKDLDEKSKKGEGFELKPLKLDPKCPLCGGGLANNGGPFCGGDTCEPAQCVHVGAEGRCIWPQKKHAAEGTLLCAYHTTSGKQCPLCEYELDGSGPYCAGNCCGGNQCQGRSPFPNKGRCPWPCARGQAMCHLHVIGCSM